MLDIFSSRALAGGKLVHHLTLEVPPSLRIQCRSELYVPYPTLRYNHYHADYQKSGQN